MSRGHLKTRYPIGENSMNKPLGHRENLLFLESCRLTYLPDYCVTAKITLLISNSYAALFIFAVAYPQTKNLAFQGTLYLFIEFFVTITSFFL